MAQDPLILAFTQYMFLFHVQGLILITDGVLPGDNTKIFRQAMSLKRASVAVYPIAASKNPNIAALEKIASESSAEHVFLATSLPAIIQYVHQISQEACKGLCTYNLSFG